MRQSENITEIAKAMNAMQGQMKPAIKDSTNPHFKSRYSDLTSIWDAIRIPLTTNGLSVWQDVTSEGKAVHVTTRVVHTSSQWIEFGPLTMEAVDNKPQALGSLVSYAKRYALCAALGVVSDDDDGEEASKPATNKVTAEPEQIITIQEARALQGMIETPEEREKFVTYLKSMKINGFANIPVSKYELLKTLIIKTNDAKRKKDGETNEA